MSKAKAQKQCDRWNVENAVGSPVILHRDNGDMIPTKTRSEAYVCNAGYPVVFLEDVRGYYLLDRVTSCVAGEVRS